MTIKLYDLAGAEEGHRFSPYCWRIRMALEHKGLAYEALPWRFTEKDRIAFSKQGRVPVIVDGERVVYDSWDIARYLDEQYPEHPSLFGDKAAEGPTILIKFWTERVLHPRIARIIVPDVFGALHEKDKAYFRESREKAFGCKLEQLRDTAEAELATLRRELEPLRATVTAQPYIGGEQARFADYIAFGAFQWARCTSSQELLEAEDPIALWRTRMLGLFQGAAARLPCRAA